MTDPILIVEDNVDHQKLLAHVLEQDGFRCEIASDFISALELIKRENYSLIVTDIIMPGTSGIEFVKMLKRGHKFGCRGVPVVFVSSRAKEDWDDLPIEAAAFCHKSRIVEDLPSIVRELTV